MTRLAVLTDIHGNLPALEAVIDDMQQFHPDHVIVGGDLINGVPFDAEVVGRVVSLGWTAIRGNHEFYLLDYGTPRLRENMRHSRSPAWLNERLKDWLPYIATMPDELRLYYRDGPPIYLTHGLPMNPYDAVTRTTPDETIIEWFRNIQETTIITGHYHLPVERHVRDWYFINPGPVGALMDGTNNAAYVLLDAAGDHWTATFRCVPYDFARVEEAFQRHKLDSLLGVEGLLKCEQHRRARPTIGPFGEWLAANHPGGAWSYERAYEFLDLPLEAIWEYVGEAYFTNPEIPLPRPVKNTGQPI